jgi:hypothetical protein
MLEKARRAARVHAFRLEEERRGIMEEAGCRRV